MDERFTPYLHCDCGAAHFRIQLKDDDSLLVICGECGGQALVLGTWEEMPTAEEATA